MFTSLITETWSDALQPNEERTGTVHTYALEELSRLWVEQSQIEGSLLTLTTSENTGVRVTVCYQLVADDPDFNDAGDLFDMEEWLLQFPNSFLFRPGTLTVWIKVKNNNNEEVSLSPSTTVNFGFTAVVENTGL